ncbi:MAG: hypothetical protein WCG92_02515 [Hyphomicrobiales bacterium]|nr:hypothetical protein [Alphaproteobacteria bacterium]
MDEPAAELTDPRDEIARLEARIEALAAKIEGCRKFILASRVALALGGLVLTATMVGAIAPDGAGLTAAIVAVLGGFVLLGSNSSTAREAADEMAAAEAQRAALIGSIELQVVGRATLH